jgi:hypothetical protein
MHPGQSGMDLASEEQAALEERGNTVRSNHRRQRNFYFAAECDYRIRDRILPAGWSNANGQESLRTAGVGSFQSE